MKISDKNAETPMDLRYVKILSFAMRTISSWPGKELGENVWKLSDYYIHYLHVQAWTGFLTGFFYVVLNAKKIPFLILGHNCITSLISFTSLSKISLLALRKKFHLFGKIFFTKMHLIYFKNKSEYAMKVHLQVHRMSELLTFYFMSILGSIVIFFNIGPIYVNFSEGVYTEGIPENSTKVYALAAYYSFPFECDYLTNFKAYVFVSLYACLLTYFCGAFMILLDLYLYIIVLHIWGHFKILRHDIKAIPRPIADASKMNEGILLEEYTAEESKEVKEKLKECMQYHNLIKEFTKMMSDVFESTLLIYTWFLLCSSCLLLLECSYMNPEAFMRYGPLTLVVFQELIQFGIMFELIGTAGENLETAVYDIPWECMDMKNRKIVLFFLMNVQKPVRVKALGVVDMGVTTVASILKTSFSYFTFLRTIDSN